MLSTKIGLAAVAGLSLALGSSAMASYDWDPALDLVIDLGDLHIPFLGTVEFPDVATTGEVVGWSFSGYFYSGGAYTDETQLEILLNGNVVQTLLYDDWDFYDEWQPGFYAHGVGGDQWLGDGDPDWGIYGMSGTWSLRFSDPTGWGPINWDGAQFTFHAIPAPGSLALVLLGAAAVRRRR